MTADQIKAIVLEELRGSVNDTADVYTWINYAQEYLASLVWWRELEVWPPFQISLVGPYTTGTIQLTTGSATVVGDGTTNWTAALHSGQVFQPAGEDNYYWISAVPDSNSLTLTTPYIGANQAAGNTYTIYTVNYALPTDLEMMQIRTVTIQNIHRELFYLDEKTRSQVFPNILRTVAEPTHYMDYGQGNIQFFPIPAAPYVVDIRYQRKPRDVSAAQQSVDFNADKHRCIAKGAEWQGWLWNDQSDRADEAQQQFEGLAKAHVERNDKNQNYTPRLLPFNRRWGLRRSGLIPGIRVTGGNGTGL